MKVALCLSGHLRSYRQTYPSLKKYIIDFLNPDIFIHTWDTIGISSHIDGNTVHQKTASQKNEIENLYHPKSLIVEKLMTNLGNQYRKLLVDQRNPNAIANMFYKIYQADRLRQNHENVYGKYDLVIRARPDLEYQDYINYYNLLDVSQNNQLYVPDFGHYDGLNDQFAVGNSETMKKYSSCYIKLPQIKVAFKPEVLLKAHILRENIPIEYINIPFTIKRLIG